ncbi:MAG: TolC family protein, partial [Dehalococcoidia bacterium]|nr:TolC family protein [Dehalococcoidia bacterium]
EAETQKHRLGRISTLTLAQVQERADDAELALLRARSDLWLALATLRVSLGGEPMEPVEQL